MDENDVIFIEDDKEQFIDFKSELNIDELSVTKKMEPVIDNAKSYINIRKRVDLTSLIETEYLIELSTSTSNPEIQETGMSSTSEDKKNKSTEEFNTFLKLCKNCECETKYKQLIDQKLPKLQEKFNQANEKYTKSTIFKTILKENIGKVKRKPSDVILFFGEIYRELSAQKKRTIETTVKDIRNLEKLKKVLKQISKKINKLEKVECDFDEGSNSAYMIVDRYKKRATMIYQKICTLTNKNPYESRLLYKKLNISYSKYSEINRAVNRLYNKTKLFPSYYDMDRCVRKRVKQKKLIIPDTELTFEIYKIFTHVGELLKRRRKYETYESIHALVEPSEQLENPELEKLMDLRHIENNVQIDKVFEKFTTYQEQGKDPSVSSDSDDSNHESDNLSD